MPDLSDFGNVLCDSLDALQQARAAGLRSNCRVRSSSPYIVLNGFAEPLEHDGDRLMRYWNAAAPLVEDIFDRFREAHAAQYAALLAARVALQMHRQFTRAIFLDATDFENPICSISVETGHATANRLLNFGWGVIQAENPKYSDVRFPVRMPKIKLDAPGFLHRLRMVDTRAVAYRALLLSNRYFGFGRKPGIEILKTNELVIETAAELGFMGLRLVESPHPLVTSEVKTSDDKIPNRAEVRIEEFAKEWFVPKAANAFASTWVKQLQGELQRYIDVYAAQTRRFSSAKSLRPAAILTNFSSDAATIAMADAATDHGIPFIGFQHGVTREICRSQRPLAANFENSAGSLFVAFNEEAVAVSDKSHFRACPSVSVGLPRIFRSMRAEARVGKNETSPVLYVSTALLAGTVNYINGGLSDIERVRREVRIVDDVLSKVPHQITYKTYPSRDRYPDPDPSIDAVLQAGNIKLFDQSLDLRYIINQYRLVISSRATSTISWCLAADIPFVFIDHPDHIPLRDNLRPTFEDAMFYFRWNADTGLSDLRNFLCQPMEKIDLQWRQKSKARAVLFEHYFGKNDGMSGKRAAHVLMNLISTMKPREKTE